MQQATEAVKAAIDALKHSGQKKGKPEVDVLSKGIWLLLDNWDWRIPVSEQSEVKEMEPYRMWLVCRLLDAVLDYVKYAPVVKPESWWLKATEHDKMKLAAYNEWRRRMRVTAAVWIFGEFEEPDIQPFTEVCEALDYEVSWARRKIGEYDREKNGVLPRITPEEASRTQRKPGTADVDKFYDYRVTKANALKRHDSCVQCGGTAKAIKARGLCTRCYWRATHGKKEVVA